MNYATRRLSCCAIFLAFFAGCNFGDPVDLPPDTEDTGVSNNEVDMATPPACGDGTVDPGELCDGDCPTSCDDGDECTADSTEGTPETCDVECVNTPIDGCGEEPCGNGTLDPDELCDGDCPTMCDDGDVCTDDVLTGSADTCDADCVFTDIADCVDPADCGNGVIDFGETCDGDCPSCDDGDICTEDVTAGEAATCDVQCTNTPIAGCVDPADCGNGVLDPGELCDGNCPASCDDGDACTSDVSAGSPSTCDVACVSTDITQCVNGDGCCPSACTFAQDDDCACIPTTCADLGQQCGMLDDGCGQTVMCGPCGAFESCFGTQCLASLGVGDACADDSACPQSGRCNQDGFPGGYCTVNCPNGDSDCPNGTTCVDGVDLSDRFCAQSCTSDSECRSDYACLDRDADGSTECVPFGAGTAQVGEACIVEGDCAGGVAARCRTELPDGRWEGGYCLLTCDADADCPAGTQCLNDRCFDACANDSECRPGHRCVDVGGDGRFECWGALDAPLGGACSASEQCAIWDAVGPKGCILEQDGDYPGGICTQNCPNGDADCPSGSHCSLGICKPDCADDLECRLEPEYACVDHDLDGRLECDAVGLGTQPVGAACTLRSECSGMSPNDDGTALCIREAPDGRWADGYCSFRCLDDGDCPGGTHCWAGQACVSECTTDADCRTPGQFCSDLDNDSRLECFGGLDRGVGDPCNLSEQCGSVGTTPQCRPPSAMYQNGYCTDACADDSECPTGSTCYAGTQCELTCLSSSECRDGYICVDADSDGDAECHAWPTGSVGDPCTVTTGCRGDDSGNFAICRAQQTATGYCSIECGAGQGTCPDGTTCHDVDGLGTLVCLVECDPLLSCPDGSQVCRNTSDGLLCF